MRHQARPALSLTGRGMAKDQERLEPRRQELA
jgi:hypothetical protein